MIMKKRQYKKTFKKELEKMPPEFIEILSDEYFRLFPVDLKFLKSMNKYPVNVMRYVQVFKAMQDIDWKDVFEEKNDVLVPDWVKP